MGENTSNGVTGPIIAAVIAAGGTSGITLYMSPGIRLDVEQMSYTGSMHKQYAETVDARFSAVYAAMADQTRRINEIRSEHKEMRKEIAIYHRIVIDGMERVHDSMIERRNK